MALWIIPILFGGTAIWIAARSWRVARWRSVTGTVRDIGHDEAIDAWVFTFAFDEPGGWTSEARLTSEDRRAFEIGQQVPLRRDPMDPSAIETFDARRVAIVLAMLGGLAGLSMVVLILG